MIRNALFLCVVCALVFVFYLPSYVRMQDMNEKNHAYEKRISDLERENARLDDERKRLTDDPVYFEKVAREKMGIIKDGEVVYKVLAPGQKKNGLVSEESAFVIKSSNTVEKPKAAVKTSAKTPVKTSSKAVAKTALSAKAAAMKAAAAKAALAKKKSSTKTKKKTKSISTTATTVSTKE